MIVGGVVALLLAFDWQEPSFSEPLTPLTPGQNVAMYAAWLAPSLLPAIVGLLLGMRASRSRNRAGTGAAVTAGLSLTWLVLSLAVLFLES